MNDILEGLIAKLKWKLRVPADVLPDSWLVKQPNGEWVRFQRCPRVITGLWQCKDIDRGFTPIQDARWIKATRGVPWRKSIIYIDHNREVKWVN